MTDKYNHGPPGEPPTAGPKGHHILTSDASLEGVNGKADLVPTAPTTRQDPRRARSSSLGSMSAEANFTKLIPLPSHGMHPTRQIHTYGQAFPEDAFAPYSQPANYGQIAPQGSVNQPLKSYMMPHDQVYGGPPIADCRSVQAASQTVSNGQVYGGSPDANQPAHHMMTPRNRMMPSQLASPPPSSYNTRSRQQCNAFPTDNFPTPNRSQYHGLQNTVTLTHHMASSMASRRASASPDMILRQSSREQEKTPLRDANAVALASGEPSSAGVTKRTLNAESSGIATMSLRDIARSARRLAGLHDEDRDVQQSIDQQIIAQQRGVRQPIIEQRTETQAASKQSKLGQTVDQPPAPKSPAAQKAIDSRPAALKPTAQPEKDEQYLEEYESTSTPYLSVSPSTSDSGKQDEHDSDQEMDDESQARAVTPQSANGLDKVDRYAFNFSREAYDHNVPQQHSNGITIHVGSLAAMTTSLKQHREETEKKTDAADKDKIPPLLPRANEFQKGPKTIECVWVGMLPSPTALRQIQSKLDQPAGDNGGKGSSKKPFMKRLKNTNTVADMREDEMKVIDFDRNALRVVAKKSDKVTRDTHIYALLQAGNASSLQGFKVGFDDVFYFREFRDDTTKSALPRKQATIARIRASAFPSDSLAVSQSPAPAPTIEESSNQALTIMLIPSPLSSLSMLATPSPGPGTLAPRCPSVASQPPKLSTNETAQSVPSSSKVSSNQNEKKVVSSKPGKRKADGSLVAATMRHWNEARKKARAEGFYVSPSDSEGREKIEIVDRDALADRVENFDGGHMDLASDYSADVDEAVDPARSAADNMCMDISFERNVDVEAYPEHTVGAQDPGFLSHTNDLIKNLSHVDNLTGKEPKTVSFRSQNGQVIDKNSISTNREGYDGDDEGQGSSVAQKQSVSLVEKIQALANELATNQDIIGLQQAITIVQCIQSRRGPPKTSALGLSFNVPNGKHIPVEDCAQQLEQLRALLPGLEDDNELHDDVLAWMVKGLQITGQSLSIDILRSYLIAFAELYKFKFGDVQTDRMSRNVLVDMICCARDKAEEISRLAAMENGTGLDGLEADGECSSHPYVDPNEEVVYQPAVWERPEE